MVFLDEVILASDQFSFQDIAIVAFLVKLGFVLVSESLIGLELIAEEIFELIEMGASHDLRGSLMLESTIIGLGVLNHWGRWEESQASAVT